MISPSRAALTAWALRSSGTVQMIVALLVICLMLIEIACLGTSSKVGNHPSFDCCVRHFLSSSTRIKGASVSKSAGGSLKRQMTVFAYTHKSHVNIILTRLCLKFVLNFHINIGCIAIYCNEILNRRNSGEKPFLKVANEAG